MITSTFSVYSNLKVQTFSCYLSAVHRLPILSRDITVYVSAICITWMATRISIVYENVSMYYIIIHGLMFIAAEKKTGLGLRFTKVTLLMQFYLVGQ